MNKTKNYIDTAFQIGAYLCRTALWNKEQCNWVDLKFNEHTKKFYSGPLTYDFYEGTSGIAFFLYNLFHITGEKIFKTTAAGALSHSFSHRNDSANPYGLSFYQGKAGLAYVLLKAAIISKDKDYLKKAGQVFNEIVKEVKDDVRFDILSGLAGIIPSFIYGAHILKKKSLLKSASGFADRLIENATVVNGGMSWNYRNEFANAHTGFGHGSSGMAYAFLLLFKHTQNKKYAEAAISAFKFDDDFYNAEHNGWKSFQEINMTGGQSSGPWQEYPCMWCYGSAGIGLAKLSALLITGEPAHLDFLQKAIDKVFSVSETVSNYSLCHGHFSNAELLLTAGRHLKNKKWIEKAHAIATRGIEETAQLQREWICGGRGQHQTLGFMNGIAGIGNFYLRMADQQIQSGLFLEEITI